MSSTPTIYINLELLLSSIKRLNRKFPEYRRRIQLWGLTEAQLRRIVKEARP